MDATDALTDSPALLPVERQGDAVRVKRMTEADYRQASFLDQRLFQPGKAQTWIAWSDLAAAARRLPRRTHFIFHLGHVGSTLLARLLGEHPAVFCLREPAMLRSLATTGRPLAPAQAVEADVLLRLFSRTWRPQQHALIKATSFVSEAASELMGDDADARAVALGVTPPVYLRVILGGPQSRGEIEALSSLRRARLEARLGASAPARSEGERIAMSWLCEAMCLQDAAARSGGRIRWLDFDRFLAGPAAELAGVFSHLGAPASTAWLRDLASGALMRRYAKGPEHAYDADLRREVMAQAERLHGHEVRAGMDWLQRMAAVHPPVVEALRRAAAAARPVGG